MVQGFGYEHEVVRPVDETFGPNWNLIGPYLGTNKKSQSKKKVVTNKER